MTQEYQIVRGHIVPPVETATVYFTSLCNSGCQTCDIWKETNRVEFNFDEFKRIIRLPFLEKTTWALIGGEFTVYSRYVDVVRELNDLGLNYYLITNGILPGRIKKIYETTTVKNLSLSLDAYGEKHDTLRGAPNNFAKIMEIITWVKENHPETKLRVCFTMSNFNTRDDLLQVIEFARRAEVDVKFGIAVASELFLARTAKEEVTLKTDELYEFEDVVRQINPGDQYLQLYRAWKRGWSPKCDGILSHLVMMYDGSVKLCEAKMVDLGNLYERPLEEIWYDPDVRKKLEHYKENCNDCWMSCMRKHDAQMIPVEQVRRIQAVYGYLK